MEFTRVEIKIRRTRSPCSTREREKEKIKERKRGVIERGRKREVREKEIQLDMKIIYTGNHHLQTLYQMNEISLLTRRRHRTQQCI